MEGSCSRFLEKSTAAVCICTFSYMSFPHAYVFDVFIGVYEYLCTHCCSFILCLRYPSLSYSYRWYCWFTYKYFYMLVWLLFYSFHVNYIMSFRVTIWYFSQCIWVNLGFDFIFFLLIDGLAFTTKASSDGIIWKLQMLLMMDCFVI